MCCCFKNAWGWLVTFCTFLLILPVTGILSSFGVIFVKLQHEYHLSDFALGWIGSVAFGFMFAASPISTGLFKRFGHRKVAIVGVILCSAGLMLSCVVPHPYYLFGTYSLMFGIGSNFIDNTTLNLVGTYFPRKNSARASCFATLGWSVGSLALNPGIEYLCERFGWRKTFLILGCSLLIHGLLCAATFSKRVDYIIVEEPSAEDEEDEEEYYDDDEIVAGEANEVFKSNGCPPVVSNGSVDKSVLATQLSTIEETAVSNENVNHNCQEDSTLTRKTSVTFAATTRLENGNVSTELATGKKDSNVSRKDSIGKSRRDSASRGRRESTGRRDSTSKGRRSSSTSRTGSSTSRRDSFMSRRDSIISFISRRDSTRSNRIPIPDNTPKHTTKQYLKMFLKTFRAPGIVLWFLANIFMNLSLVFPFVNLIKYMETIGIPSARGVQVLMVFGVADLIGRGGSAILGDYIPFHTVYVYPICNLLMGGMTVALLVITTISGLYGYAVVVGIMTGIVNSMLFKASMDLFGDAILAEAWTLTLLAAGLGICFGPSIAGASYDLTESFDTAFYIGGAMYFLAAFVTIIIPCIQRRKGWVAEKKEKPRLDSISTVDSRKPLSPESLSVEQKVSVV